MKLIEDIRNAFSSARRPNTLGRSSEGLDVEQYFAGRSWQDINLNSLITERVGDSTAYLSFMTREGFAYFLPGYMIMVLRDDPKEMGNFIDSLMWHLSHPDSLLKKGEEKTWMYDYGLKEITELTSLLTPPQKRVVAEFLRHQITHWGRREMPNGLENEDARKAYDGYWRQFDPAPPDPKTANAPTPAKP